MEAAILGRKREFPKRSDWHDVRDEIMYKIVLAKFEQNKEIQKILLGNPLSFIVTMNSKHKN